MGKYFLFLPQTAADWSVVKKFIFWLWNLLALLAGALGIGVLSLCFAAIHRRAEIVASYFQAPLLLLLNLAPVVLLALLLYCLLGRVWLAYGITAGVVLGLTMGNWFKLQFRSDPLLFEDLLLLKEAGNMAGKYKLYMTRSMAVALAAVVLGGVLLFFFARGRAALWPRMGGMAAVILLLLPLKSLCLHDDVYQNLTASKSLENPWSFTHIYISKGFVYPFLHSITNAADTPPVGYNSNRAKRILGAYQDEALPTDLNISLITVMLEAYNDLSKFNVPGLNEKVFADYHRLERQGVSGNLVTNIFAAGTVNTERCYLTGYSQLGSFRVPSNSYPWYFRNQGYTVEGAHPCYQWFYNRLNINQNLGFQRYLFVENYFAPMTDGEVGNDDLFFPSLIQLWEENKVTGKPYFSYNLTYQGHGPYTADQTWFGDDYVTGGSYTQEERNILNNYFGSLYNTNQNLVLFFDYFRTQPEPVVIVLFGDHNPWLGDGNSVYHTLGINLDVSTQEGFLNYYSTRYLIWANDAAKEALGRDFSGTGPDIGPYFLMNEVFRQAGWRGPAFMQATQQVMDRVPVLSTPTGLYVENGVLTDVLTPEGQALVDDFDMVQYYWRRHFVG